MVCLQVLHCLALLMRYIPSDVLMPLLLPNLASTPQREFFWHPSVSSTPSPQPQQIMISQAVRALGELSAMSRLRLMLLLLDYAPPRWTQNYVEAILGQFEGIVGLKGLSV